jgi:Ca2+-transporting ATPase
MKEGNNISDNSWHTKNKEEIFRELGTSSKGLSEQEILERLERDGLNEIRKKKKEPVILKILKNFNSPLIYILLLAMIISFIFEHVIDGYVILFIIFINGTISFVQERKAEKAIESLEKMIISYAKVYRNEDLKKIPASQLVKGDIILLEEGDKVPADARLIEITNFRTQEASLTGESFPVDKELKILKESISLGDKINMVFMGTVVVSGSAKAVVVATGEKTAIGQVAESIQEIIQPKMHFNEKVSKLAFQMATFAIIGASLTFLIGFFMHKLELVELFLFTIASLVSGIPEGLPAVLIIVLAVGANRMAKRSAIIRHLPAVETLGVATVIATDKTGTLTQNSMAVEKIVTSEGIFEVTGNGWVPSGEFYKDKKLIKVEDFSSLQKLCKISALSNKGNLLEENEKYEIVGDPTEVALLVLSKKSGLDKQALLKKERILDDFVFSSEVKYRATLIESKGKKQIYSIGAFEKILKKCSFIMKGEKKTMMTKEVQKKYLESALSFAKEGYRVLSLAYKDVTNSVDSFSENLMSNLTFVGFVAMKDPPREGVKEAIQKAKNAGIRIIMKTGDHKETAIAIAREIGLINSEKPKVLTQEDLDGMSEEEFRKAVREVDIFARVTAKVKMRIVQILQEQGEVVAMTGDGVNDAPALKMADIGIAMGIIGTDVARESSEVILANDNFVSIVDAIEEGRIVFQNVRQTSFFLVTTNVAEDFTIISSLAMSNPLPMIPIQLLFLNIVTDTFNGIALTMEPGHHDVLSQLPRNKKENILDKELIFFLVLMAGLMALGTIPLFVHFLPEGIEKARTVAFVSMSMFQLFNVFNMRSLHKSIFKIGFFSNKWIQYSLGISLTLLLLVIYVPFLQNIFRFVPLSIAEFLIISLIASSVLVFGEIYKFIKYKKENNG